MHEIKQVVSDLVSEVVSNDHWVVSVLFGQADKSLLPLVCAVVVVMPKAIPIELTAAPLCIADVIVKYHHYSCLSEGLNSCVEDLHRCFANKLWVCCQISSIYNWIFEVLF